MIAPAVPARGQGSQGNRRGAVFAVRVTDEERARLEATKAATGGPRGLGPWLLWRALAADGHYRSSGTTGAGGAEALPGPGPGNTPAAALPDQAGHYPAGAAVPLRTILDLCAGSGSWGAPYEAAGYRVLRVTLPEIDVRTYRPPPGVWGVLAGPPCTEFSLAKNGSPRDFVKGMETVAACMRIILQCRPRWWALENPTGYLGKFLGRPRDVWQPHDFGDPWTKRTAIWGDFALPVRGPFVAPTGSAMDRASPAERAITPPGFARAFFAANP